MKDDILAFIKHFEVHGNFTSGCNSLFINLVPKSKDHLTFGDYRPISLIRFF